MFSQLTPKNFHVQYLDVNRHWSPRSEQFAGGDNLITAIMRGWEVSETVYKEDLWHAGVRQAALYHFHLTRDEREITMPVVENPYVTRMLYTSPFEVLPLPTANTEAEQVS